MKRCLTLFMLAAFGMVAAQGSRAEQVTVSGAPVYVTKGDCMALVRHHPSVGTAYQPGTDVHGKYVAPADLPNSNPSYALSEKVQFQLKINPMAYGQAGGAGAAQSGKYANTALGVAQVSVDPKSGQISIDGKPLGGDQDQVVLEACRKAGFR